MNKKAKNSYNYYINADFVVKRIKFLQKQLDNLHTFLTNPPLSSLEGFTFCNRICAAKYEKDHIYRCNAEDSCHYHKK